MSDGNHSAGQNGTKPPYIANIRRLKADVDVIFRQLSTGDYASPDTFANNWEHLMKMVDRVEPLLREPGVMDALARADLQLAADLLAISRSVVIMQNFIHCLARRAKADNDRKK